MQKNKITENAPSTTSLTPMEKSLKTIESLLKKKGWKTPSVPLKDGPAGGLVKLDVMQDEGGGLRPGKQGFVRTSNGRTLRHEVKIDPETDLALVPPLTARGWRLIDGEIAKERYRWKNDEPDRNILILPEHEAEWGAVLLQGKAALLPSPFEHTLTRLTRLKLQKPTQAMDEAAVAVFLEDICDHFEGRGFCYHAIDEGIKKLIEREEDKFFPSMRVMISYIHPIHWKLQNRVEMLESILMRNFRVPELSFDNKE